METPSQAEKTPRTGRTRRFFEHRAAPLVVAAGAPALLFLSMVLGPDCEFCEPFLQMAYLWLATFVVLPAVALLVAIGRLRRTQWSLAGLSVAVSLLLVAATIT